MGDVVSLEKKLRAAIKSNNINKIEIIFEDIYYEYGKLVGFIISKYVSKKEDIEELVDDVFINFFKVLYKTKIENIKYYLVTQAKNASINFINKKSNKIDYIYDESIIFNEIDNKSKYYEIINEMKHYLDENEINIIILHTIYNYTFDEIASKLSKPLSSIASTYRRAIKKYNKGVKLCD